MPQFLASADCFKILRSLARDEMNRLRRRTDPFFEELSLTPENRFNEPPLALTGAELDAVAGRVAGFFTSESLRPAGLLPLATLGAWADAVVALWGNEPNVVTFFTSGSTGDPKPVLRHLFFLEQDARFTAEQFETIGRIVVLAPPHHIYGFIYAILLPKLYGLECFDGRGLAPAALVERLEQDDLVVATPFHWNLLARHAEMLPRVHGLCSGAPLPPQTTLALKAKGLGKWLELYGSTECGAMGYRQDPEAPFTLCPHWAPCDAQTMGQETFTRRSADGALSAPYVFQDHLEWVDSSRFFVRGRRDEAVQVAGVNVFPARVERCILESGLVAECAVRLMHPDQGDRLKAFIVTHQGQTPDPTMKDQLNAFLASQLGPLELPRSITYGDKLPCTPMGKLMDW